MAKFDVFNAPPEIAKGITAAIWTIEGGEYSVSWGVTKTMNSGIEADIHIALVAARLEHKCIPTVAPLPVITFASQFMPNFIDTALAVRITWREDSNSV